MLAMSVEKCRLENARLILCRLDKLTGEHVWLAHLHMQHRHTFADGPCVCVWVAGYADWSAPAGREAQRVCLALANATADVALLSHWSSVEGDGEEGEEEAVGKEVEQDAGLVKLWKSPATARSGRMAACCLHDSLKAVAVAANQSLAVLPHIPSPTADCLLASSFTARWHVSWWRKHNSCASLCCISARTGKDSARSQSGELKPKQSGVSRLPARLVIKTVNQSDRSAAAAAAINRTHAYISYICIWYIFLWYLCFYRHFGLGLFSIWSRVFYCLAICARFAPWCDALKQLNYRLSCIALHKDICWAQSLLATEAANKYIHTFKDICLVQMLDNVSHTPCCTMKLHTHFTQQFQLLQGLYTKTRTYVRQCKMQLCRDMCTTFAYQ